MNRPAGGRRCLIVGGGAAGLAAAFAHLERGWRPLLLERSRRLGGRARSFGPKDRALDNGPHVILGRYRAFRRLLRLLGREDAFDRPPALRLAWLEPGGRIRRLVCPRGPRPWPLVAGLARLDLPARERWALLATGARIFVRRARAGEDLAGWAQRTAVAAEAFERLLRPLCLAVANASPERTDAALFLHTLRLAFGASAAEGALWIPRRPWSEILAPPPPGLPFEVRRARVAELAAQGGPAPAVRLTSGSVLSGHERLVLAVPWHEAARLAGPLLGAARFERLEASPIVTVHLALEPGLVAEDPVLVLHRGRHFHFLCRRAAAPPGCDHRALLAGAAHALDALPAARIAALAVDELGAHLPRRAPVRILRVVRERAATFVPAPGTQSRRPPPGPTGVPGLHLAGDWTATGLPATLEGAALSGFRSAEST